MATINIRIEDELKERAYAALDKLGITPSDLLRQTLQYVADQEKLPFKTLVVSDEDAELLEIVKQRLATPQKGIKVSLDDL
ncbi:MULTISPECIES: type II toxin-antitoxin system RelB/DinJ family antitoxin [Acinetobacter]|uniref:Bifunctional antitoxin/transcriptional repressor RelB n=2 Tax=Acinetobacter TaxID=469 RepID=A0A1Z9Z2M7_9GAMM|nr:MULTISPECIES: type II toxin-antitoxin system RelB/DinJ family antitoxin [Acinetobacter]KAA8733897.1 type II toxin-antitoxin system RelB/DinJ family antitoxin [Acinetobacter qingfengensis]OEY96182.1 bifunctional antitoxin/transcriptional repressor RelB [Acinetobacter qingfengensis]OUY08721.1 bifunctional antitoxin/transcriptional repressor RelB [Acinetobacter populi]